VAVNVSKSVSVWIAKGLRQATTVQFPGQLFPCTQVQTGETYLPSLELGDRDKVSVLLSCT